MKKCMTIVLAVLVTLVLCGCGNAAPKERSLYTQGLDVANLVVQAAQSDAYLDQLSGNASLREILEDAAQGDYSTPKAVYELRFSSLPEESDTLPEPLAKALHQQLLPTLISQLNAAAGAETLAAASVCTMSKTFVASDATDDTLYLYQYETGYPIAVIFTPGEDGAVSARGCFLLCPDVPQQGTAEEIADSFAQILGISAPQVTAVSP